MTTTELTAGRELDAAVAEKVFGWRREPQQNGVVITELWFEPDGRRHLWTGIPRYSTDIAAAWLVYLEVMNRAYSRRQRFYDALQGQTAGRISAEPHLLIAWPDVLTVLRHEMPLAICRAALAAVRA